MNAFNFLMEWLFKLPYEIANLWNWLSTPLPNLNISPLAILSATGIIGVVSFLVPWLVLGGHL